MMLARDFREPEWRCCSDRRSNHDHSRRAGFRFLADSSPRLAHSTAHRKFAGMAFCRSPIRISCGVLQCEAERSWTFSELQSALADCGETKTIEIEAQLYVGKRPISKGIGRVIRRFVVLAFRVGAATWRANVAGPKGKSVRCVVAGMIGRHCNVLSADRGDSISGGRWLTVQQISSVMPSRS
jgi:hypothetical protein